MHIEGNSDRRMLVLKKEQKIISSITEFAREHRLAGGMIHGIGAIKDVELGFYDLEKRDYLRQQFKKGDFELLSLNGNISEKEGEPYEHIHLSMSGPDFKVIGGHLFEATVAVTAEIFITLLGKMPRRDPVEEVGLHLICGIS